MHAARLQLQLRSRLERRMALVDHCVRLARPATTYTVCVPASVTALMRARHAAGDTRLPYWAVAWPSGIALAEALLAQPGQVAGRRALELGCGLGITATAALASGARLTAIDCVPAALLLCRLNTLRNTGRAARTLRLDWTQPLPAARLLARERFPVLLAADVLYDARDVAPLLELVERVLAPGGTLWLAEPGRPSAERWLALALERGWRDQVTAHQGPWPDRADRGVVVRVHRLRQAA